MSYQRALIAISVVGMLATGCGSSDRQVEQAGSVPAPPPVNSEIRTSPSTFSDDLVHLIATPKSTTQSTTDNPATATDGSASTAAVDRTDQQSLAGTSTRWSVSPEQLRYLPNVATVEFRDGTPGYINTVGQFISLAETGPTTPEQQVSTQATSGSKEASPKFENPIVNALANNPAVESIMAIGDGSYAITTRDPSLIDLSQLDIIQDAPFGLTTEPYETYQWPLDNTGTNLDQTQNPPSQISDSDIDGTEAAALANGQGVVVAVIDSGVDFSHVDLAGSSWLNPGETCGNGVDDDNNGFIDDCTGWDFAYNDNTSFNQGADSHGTHVAGIIAANLNQTGVDGIAPAAKIMDLNVQSGGGMSASSVAAAVRYAADNGADIINMSLGSSLGMPRSAGTVVENSIAYATDKGALVVVAAGNDGVNLDNNPVYPAVYQFDGMITVGATTPSDTRTSFSNYSETLVDMFAPGLTILSTTPGNDYRFYSGTSQATPLVAGAAALVMQQYPTYSAAEVIDQLTTTADPLEALVGLSSGGSRLNALNAIEGTVPQPFVREPTEVEVSISGLGQASSDVEASLEIALPADWFAEAFHWELSLLVSGDAGTFAVAGHTIQIAGASQQTSPIGAVRLGAGGNLGPIPIGTSLPEGTYSFLIEAIADSDQSVRLGGASVVTFNVSSPQAEAATDNSAEPTTPIGQPPTGDPGSPESQDGGNSSGSVDTDQADDPSTSDGSGTSSSGSSSEDTGSGSSEPRAEVEDKNIPDSGGGSTESGSTEGHDPGSPTSGDISPDSTNPDDSSPDSTNPDSTDSTQDGSSQSAGNTGDSSAPSSQQPGSEQANDSTWAISNIDNQVGFTGTPNLVQISGSFPAVPFVWFGEQPGTTVYASNNYILVETPIQAVPGLVDISLQLPGSGIVLLLPDAYVFLSPSPVPGGDSSDGSYGEVTPVGDTGSDSNGSGTSNPGDSSDQDSGDSPVAPPSTPVPEAVSGGEPGSGSETGGTESPATTQPAPSSIDPQGRQSRTEFGEPIDLGNGLTGSPIEGSDPTVGIAVCATDPCQFTSR